MTDWRRQHPRLSGTRVRLRELCESDSASLFALLTREDVTRFISLPPTSVEGFERFIAWTIRERRRGAQVCFAVTLPGCDTAIGLFQLRRLDATFKIADWGFAIAFSFWGTGIFEEGARLAMSFAFETIGIQRLEARAAVQNGRGKGALLKLGAVQEGILRKSCVRGDETFDQALYAILAADWKASAKPGHTTGRLQLH